MKNRNCQSCGTKLSPLHSDDVCDDCWEASDSEPEQLATCAICGSEVFDNHEICDGCKEDAREHGACYED